MPENPNVKLTIAWIGKTKEPAIQSLTDEYLKRLSRYGDVQGMALRDESALLKLGGREARPTRHTLVLLDSRGKQLSSEEFAEFLGNHQDRNPLPLLFAVGPAERIHRGSAAGSELVTLSRKNDSCPRTGASGIAGTTLPRVHYFERTPLPPGTLKTTLKPLAKSGRYLRDVSHSQGAV